MIGVDHQAIAQKAGHLDRAGGFGNAGRHRRCPAGQSPGVAAYDRLRQFSQMLIDLERDEQIDPLQHSIDLPCRMLGRRGPQPALHGGAVLSQLRDRPLALRQQIRIDRLEDLANQRRFMPASRLGDVGAQFTLSWNNLLVIVEPSTCELQQSLPITGP
jgi:hypothetical protein